MQTYPYDWKGTNPTNAFTEHRVVDSEKPEERVVVLDHRPFFGNTLEITAAGSTTPLTPGVDYQLAYMLPELDESVASSVYCGVQLINPQIGGELIFKGQVLGESFYSPFVDILDYLVKYLNNPVDADWLKLDGRPTLYAPQPAATSWADLVNKKYLASAVRDVELDADAANTAIAQKLAELKTTVAGLHAEIVAFNYPAHIASHKAHNITVAQTGAHPVSLKTPDTFLAYGKTLRTLTAEIRALGLQQSDINNYIEKWVSKDVDGVFIQQLAANRSLFKSKSGVSEITFTDTAFILKSNGSIVLSAGYLESDLTLKFMEWKSGTNTLRIESSGNALGMDKLTLNGKVLLTTNLLLEYQAQGNGSGTPSDPDDTKVYINGLGGLAFTGKGSKADPIKGTLTLPTASTTVKGVARLKKGPGTESTGYASTPDSLDAYEGKASDYVPKTTMLNSKPMNDTTDRKVTKAEIGLDKVDNTADIDKPFSTEQEYELSVLSAKDHKHAWADLPLPAATAMTKGIGTFTTNEAGLAAGRGVAPNVLKSLSERLDIVAAAMKDVKTGVVVDFAALNTSTWIANGTTRVEVQDLQYFWQFEGERGEGEASGGIDIQTTPMFQWFKSGNRLEDTWPAAVLSTGPALSFTGISKTPALPLNPEPITVVADAVGNISVKSLLAKRRLRARSGKLNVYVAGGGAITIYLNGVSVATGNSPLAAEITLDPGDITHCLGIRVDCNDPTKAAAMMYEVYDGTVPLARSRVGDAVQWLQEFVTEWKGIRHYLYMSMLSGSLFSRAEPIEAQGIDLDHQLIGAIDVPKTGLVSGTKYPYQKMFDFGPSKEISTHMADTTAHRPGKTDWVLSDNGAMARMGRMTLAPDIVANGAKFTGKDTNGTLLVTQSTAPALDVLLAFSANQGQTPAQWFTPRNPKASGHPTYEGGITLDARLSDLYRSINTFDLVLFGTLSGASATYQRQACLRVRFDGSKPKIGFSTPLVTGTAGSTTAPTLTTMEAPCTVTELLNLDKADSDYARALDKTTLRTQYPRCTIRYRYDCETRVLRVWQVHTPGGVELLRLREYEIAFDFDMSHYFGGFVGMMFAPGVASATYAMIPSLYPLQIDEFKVDKYHYHRSLFESYLDSKLAVGKLAPAVQTEVTGPYFPNPELTEVFTLPADGGIIIELCQPAYLPTAFQRGRSYPGSPITNVWKTWRGNMADGAGPRYWTGFAVTSSIPDTRPLSHVVITSKSTFPMRAWIGELASTAQDIPANPTGDAIVTTVTQPAEVMDSGRPFVLQFIPPTPGKLCELRAEFTLEMYDDQGTLVKTADVNSSFPIYAMGRNYIIEKSAPFHMTSRMWDYLTDVMRTERTSDGTDFGQWA